MFTKIEQNIFNHVDKISAISAAMAHIVRKNRKSIYLFSNWVNTDFFWPLIDLIDKVRLKRENGFNPKEIEAYLGVIGENKVWRVSYLLRKN